MLPIDIDKSYRIPRQTSQCLSFASRAKDLIPAELKMQNVGSNLLGIQKRKLARQQAKMHDDKTKKQLYHFGFSYI